MSMTVIHYIGKGQAMIEVECVAKEFSKSIRFMLCDGKTVTIKRKDIISIEKHDDENESIYQINCDGTGKDQLTIENVQIGKFFAGYDFMGSVEWVDNAEDAYRMEIEEAKQIISDLESSDEPMAKDEPKTDPMMEKLQIALDGAVIDRDDFYKQYERMIKEGKPSDMIHRMYLRYEHAQGYVEGLTNAIFIAGYGIQSAVDSSKLTLTK